MMEEQQTNRKHNAEHLRTALFNRCKLLWNAGLICKLLVFVFGAIVVLRPDDGEIIGLLTIALGLGSEALIWWSDSWKGAAQGLHRKLEFEDSFGWAISKRDLVDALARYPGKLDNLCGKSAGSYFASKEQPGIKRGLQNLRESSWWSMHLGESMGWVYAIFIILIVVGCIFLLNISIGSFPVAVDQAASAGNAASINAVSSGIIKIVTASLLFIVSYGLLRMAVGYFSFASKAKGINEKTSDLLESGCSDIVPAIKLWQDYHLARASAPMLPNWIWSVRQKKLNALFSEYLVEND